MRFHLLTILLSLFLLAGCGDSPTTSDQPEPTTSAVPSLGAAYSDNFTVGATLSREQLRGNDARALAIAAREFSSISPENDMKWEEIHPKQDSFNWAPADAFVAFGEEHDKEVIGHALVWYQQIAGYVGETTDPEAMRTALREHINAVAGRYKGRIHGWDVLNEAIDDEGEGKLRSWSVPDVLGPDYVTEIFQMAKEADPDAELYYNDYNAWKPGKRAGIVRLLKRALANGAPIDAVGIQGHYGLTSPTLDEIEAAIMDYHALGLKVMFTELDVNVLPNPYDNLTADPRVTSENNPFMNPYTEGIPDSVTTALADRYADLFKLFLKHDDKITRVTFWGIYDGSTWLNDWPIKGRTNYPMLFDRAYQKKAAYHSVMELKQ